MNPGDRVTWRSGSVGERTNHGVLISQHFEFDPRGPGDVEYWIVQADGRPDSGRVDAKELSREE